MAIQYIDAAAGLEYGIEAEETWCKILSWGTVPTNPKRLTRSSKGAVDGFIVGHDASVVLNFSGEVYLPTGSRPGQEAANTSPLSADFASDIAGMISNEFTHAFTTGNVFNGITVTEWTIDNIEYTSVSDEVMTFTATATGWEGVDALPATP